MDFETGLRRGKTTVVCRKDTFIELMKNVFTPECQAINDIHILHLDGHTNHISLAAILLSRENNIILICPPAQSSHILQSLDIGFHCHIKQV